MWWLIGVDVVAHWCRCDGSLVCRCGGSLVAHQTSGGRGPGLESGIYHNDPDALQDHCEKRGKLTPEAKNDLKKPYVIGT